MSTNVEQFIPDKRLAKGYINRKINGIPDFKVFDWAREKNVNLLLKGPTQAAKTTAFRAYAAEREIPVAIVDVNAAMDPSLTVGTQVQQHDGTWVWQDGNLVKVLREDDAVIFLDECNMCHPKVMAAYHSLGDNRRHIALPTGEIVKAGKNVLIAATMNPGYIGTTPLGEAFNARFFHIKWDYDKNVEKKLLAPTVISFAERLRESESIHTPVSTAMLMRFQETIGQMGWQFAIEGFKAAFSNEEADGIGYALDSGLDDAMRQELG